MNYKVSYYLMRILGIAGIIVMLIAGVTNRTVLGGIGVGAVILGTAQSALFFNCPHCKRSLKASKGIPGKCPYCKKELK